MSYQYGFTLSRARRRVLKVYGPVDPKRQEKREAAGWKPMDKHPLPSSNIETSVKKPKTKQGSEKRHCLNCGKQERITSIGGVKHSNLTAHSCLCTKCLGSWFKYQIQINNQINNRDPLR